MACNAFQHLRINYDDIDNVNDDDIVHISRYNVLLN